MDGIAVTGSLARQESGIKTLMMTAFDDDRVLDAVAAGAVGVLLKEWCAPRDAPSR
jgi:DNA-binding NarL/FixJ family response regulator